MGFVPVPSEGDVFTALRAFLLSVLPVGIEVVAAQDNDVSEPAEADFVTMNAVTRERLSTNSTTYADCRLVGSIAGSTLTVASIQLGAILPGSSLLGSLVSPNTTIVAQLTGPLNGVGTYQVTPAGTIAQSVMQCGSELVLQPIKLTIQLDIHGPNSGDNVQTVSTLFRDDYACLWFTRQGYVASGNYASVLRRSEANGLRQRRAELRGPMVSRRHPAGQSSHLSAAAIRRRRDGHPDTCRNTPHAALTPTPAKEIYL